MMVSRKCPIVLGKVFGSGECRDEKWRKEQGLTAFRDFLVLILTFGG
jgi:hypothetical protein